MPKEKQIRVGQKKLRWIASRDISEECGKDKFFNRNYLSHDYIVRNGVFLDYEYVPLDSLESL
jgi:hypothetical protein